MKGLKGWILYREVPEKLNPMPHELGRFLEVAKEEGIQLEVFRPEQFDLVVTQEGTHSIMLEGRPIDLPDFLLPRLGAETTYFGQAVVRQIERLGVRVINSSESIDLAKDKLFSHQILAASGLPVPRTMLIKHPVDAELVEQKLRFPVVIKTLSGSKGSGVFLSNNSAEFLDLMDLIASTKGNANIIVQEFIQSSRGRDLRVFTIGGRVLACMQRSSKNTSFKANVSRGGSATRHEITPEIEWLATETARTLKLDIAGIDLLFDGSKFKVCEANSSPGFKGIETSHPELNVAHEIYRYVQLRVGFYKKGKRNSLSGELATFSSDEHTEAGATPAEEGANPTEETAKPAEANAETTS